MEVCFWGVPVIMVAGASWPIFFPPRKIRSWPEFTRPLFGVLTATVAAYALLFLVVRPLIAAQFRAHNGNIILDYQIDMVPLWVFFVCAVPMSYFVFLIRVCARQYMTPHAAH